MKLVEMNVVLGDGGVIRVPQMELEAMGLNVGDEICLSYLAQNDENRVNGAKEFILEKR